MASSAEADAIRKIVQDTMESGHLKSTIVKVTVDGKEIIREAFGESMTGVPATTEMSFRNGAVAISYVSTALLQLVDEGKVSLDDKVSKWLPDLPNSDRVTLGQLAHMTSGYVDFVLGNDAFAAMYTANPFKFWTSEDQLALAVDKPLFYEPGTNWNYAHTNYVILGLALEKITGKPVEDLLQEKILDPLGLDHTVASLTATIPEPALHAFSSERRQALKIPDGQSFYEESSFWSPSWTITHGAIQTTTIDDMHASAIAIGTGKLLSPESYQAMIRNDLIGKTRPQEGCPTCYALNNEYSYGLGIVLNGDWLLQNPLFSGYAALMSYLPAKKIAIAVAVTYDEAAFDNQGDYKNEGTTLYQKIGALLAPDEAPPTGGP